MSQFPQPEQSPSSAPIPALFSLPQQLAYERLNPLENPAETLTAYVHADCDGDCVEILANHHDVPAEALSNCAQDRESAGLIWSRYQTGINETGFACMSLEMPRNHVYFGFSSPSFRGHGEHSIYEIEEIVRTHRRILFVENSSLRALGEAVVPIIDRLDRLSRSVVFPDGSQFNAAVVPHREPQLVRVATAIRFLRVMNELQDYLDEDQELPEGGKLFVQQFSVAVDRALPALAVLYAREPDCAGTLARKHLEYAICSMISGAETPLQRASEPMLRFVLAKGLSMLTHIGPRRANVPDLLKDILTECGEEERQEIKLLLALDIAGCAVPPRPPSDSATRRQLAWPQL